MDELLIEQVRKHEVLYNHASPEYRDQQIRQEAWEEIGKELQIKAEKAKEMWDKLRRCFCNAINRRRDPTSGMAIKKKHPWKHEEQMAFILPFLEHRRTRIKLNDPERSGDIAIDSNVKDEGLEEQEEIEDADRYLVQEYISVEDEGVDTLDSEKYERADTNTESRNSRLIHIHESPAVRKRKCEVKTAVPQLKLSSIDAFDETDLFFLSLSRMTKQLPKVEQTNIKITLSNAVLTAELRSNQKQDVSEPPKWSEEDKRLFLVVLSQHGESNLSLLQTSMPHKTIGQIRGMIDHYKRLAQSKWLDHESKKSDDVRHWIDIMEKISSQQKGYIHDIIPRVLKYIALYEKKSDNSDIDLRTVYTFLSKVLDGKSTKELPERTGYFLYQCLVRLAENLQKQNIEESQYYLKQLESFEELLKQSGEEEVNPLSVPENLLLMSDGDLSENVLQ